MCLTFLRPRNRSLDSFINKTSQHGLGHKRQEISLTQKTLEAAMSAISSPLQNCTMLEENFERCLPDARTIISEAYEQFNSQITDEDACNFCSTELHDVWAAVRAIDSVQRQRQRGQNMRQVESLLRGFEMYAKVIDISQGGGGGGGDILLTMTLGPYPICIKQSSAHNDRPQ